MNQQPSFSNMDWSRLPQTHYVDNRIFNDRKVFDVEQRTIFASVWKFVCCESEIAGTNDFRTTSVAGIPLIIVRGRDGKVRALVNSCSHRGVKLVEEPAGNTRRFECLFHRWTYDTQGKCIDIPRQEGYSIINLDKAECNLKQVRCEVTRGLVFVNLNEQAAPLDDYLGACLSVFDDLFGSAELEVFHFHEQIVETDWKHWQETNLELYHEFLHVLNRKTGMVDPAYFKRQWKDFGNGHLAIAPLKVQYDKLPGSSSRGEYTLPGLLPDEFRLLDIFPDMMLNCRASVLRIDTQIPLEAGKTLIQFRGLGVKGEPAATRRRRIQDHAEFWGPFGRNLPEDMLASERQKETMGKASPFSLIAREEDRLTQDDFPVRAFYREWERRTGFRAASLATMAGVE